MNAVPDRMLALAQRFAGLSAQARQALQGKMREQGLTLEALPIPPRATGVDVLPASYAQQRLWFIWQLEPQATAYNLTGAFRLRGRLDHGALEQTLAALLARHEVLRTTFRLQGDSVQQVIHAHMACPLGQVDADESGLRDAIAMAAQAPFDLEHGPLMRARLVRLGAQDHVLVLTLHHIVTDGASLPILIEEFTRHYAAFASGQAPQVEALPIQYADFSRWQRLWLEAGEGERQLQYWREQLGDQHPLLTLPLDHKRPVLSSQRGDSVALQVPAAVLEGLRGLARAQGCTLFVVLLASLHALLHRYSGESDIRVGVPNANRTRQDVQNLLGFFINTQVLRSQPEPQQAFSSLLEALKVASIGAQGHQDVPFEQLVDALQPERSLNQSPLFQVMLNHQRAAADNVERWQLQGLDVEVLGWEERSSKFDLMLDTVEQPDGLSAAFTYATDLFEAVTIERMGRHWLNLLAAVVRDPQIALGDLPLLGADEHRDTLAQWNPAPAHYPLGDCLHQRIEHQAALRPEATAVVCEGQRLSYGELNRRANQLAWRLRERGVGPDVLVGIAMPRSLDMLVGLLAILKAGGAYVPLDPEYPQDRLAYLIEDSGTRLLISQTDLIARLPLPEGVHTLLLDASAAWLADAPPHDLPNLTRIDNLAYVIYTSGSTGKPKGTLLAHANVLRLFDATQQWFAFDERDVWSLFHSYAFDFSVWEIFGALLYGGTLVVVPYAVSRSPQDFHRLLREEGVTVLNQTPSAFRPLIEVARAARDEGPLALRSVVFGGEALDVNDLRPWFEAFGDCQPQLVNMYGITETTVHVSYRPLSLADLDAGNSSPLGLPIDDLSWYVLDSCLNPVAKGCVGELYVGGAGLARGYHRRPDLSATRFIADPFAQQPGARLYRTGDLARFSADGSLEYIGRIDHQVKIRGFRIELGEIQRCLQNHPQVAQALVLVHEAKGSKQLLGYLVAKAGVEAGSSTLRQGLRDFLRGKLPDYMVPAHLLVLDAWPLTSNGKLDRKALPLPGAELALRTWQAPQNALQADLVKLWEAVLKRAPIGIDDNFFELGGDSIISIQLVSRARQVGIRLSPKDLFQYQTVQSLARVAERSDVVQTSQGPVQGPVPLTPIQHGFFEQPVALRAHWNQSLLLNLRQRIDVQNLRDALAAVLRQHDALRLRFSQQDGQWQQTHAADGAEQAVLQLAEAADADALLGLCNQAQASLDLSQGPLLRALLVDMADGGQRLLLVVHHLVVDGVSWRVLLEDLQQASQQLAVGQAPSLPGKTSAYQHWAQRLEQYAKSPQLLAEVAYWHEQYRDVQPHLPCKAVDNPVAEQIMAVETCLDEETTRQLLQQAPAAYRTQINDLLLSALAQVICAWTGQASTLVQLEGHGREALFDDIDLSRTVGWFTSIFPVKLTPAMEPGTSLKRIKEQLRAVPQKGIGFAILRYLADQGLAALPAPAITFNYMGQFDASFDQQAPWQPAQESGGNEQAPGNTVLEGLSINGQVYDGQLRLSWSFDPRRFEAGQVQALADGYAQALRALVAHCLASAGGLTPSDVALAGLDQQQLDNLPLPASAIEDIYPLSPMQQGMLFHSLYDDEPGAYVHQLRLDVEGLQVDALRAAWQAALDAHDTLRAGFLWGDDYKQPLQLIRRRVALPLQVLDFQGQPRSALDAFAEADRQRGFQLAAAPLLRVNVLRTDTDRHHLIVTHHHILLDGWSTSQLLGEVMQRYAGIAPAASAGRYHDYMAWLAAQDPLAAEAFWTTQLGDLQEPTLLANCAQGDTASGFGEYFQVLDQAASDRLGQFAREHKVTVNSLLQSAWLLLLHRYSGQACVAFGATVAGRPVDLPGIEQQLGLFINTLPVIASPHPQHSVVQWVQAIQAQNLNLREFEHTPLAEVQRLAGQGSLFDTLLVFENYPLAEALQQGPDTGLRILDVEGREQTHFPLTVSADFGACLSLRYNYTHSAFSDGFIARLHQHLSNLLLAMVDAPAERLGRLDLLDAAEREQQRVIWNDTALAYPAMQPVQRLFELQAERTPDAPALVFAEQQLSYAELNRRANRLARLLRAQGVGPEVLVGIAAERSLELVIGLLAILKAGGAYVPLDPDYPAERLHYMIDDSAITLLLTQSGLRERLPLNAGVRVLYLDQLDLESGNDANLPQALDGAGLAYMIYTSGSTGRPKGAGNRHDALYNRLVWMQSAYPLVAGDTVLQKTPFSFDVSVWEFFWPLMVGARLALAEPGAHRDPAALVALINRHQVSTLHFVPSMLQAFVRDEGVGSCASLRQVICSGEALPAELQRHLFGVLPWTRLYNLYGPTEAAIDVTHWTCRNDGGHSVPIGQPIANLQTYVLDSSLQLQAGGCVGELYLGGVGLARGYHQRPGLTAERFVASPFGAGERLYRTGDLARYRADGVIEYIGRIDHQVKIRGLRIELGEIEAALLEQPGVAEAVVLALDIGKSKQLVAYLVPEAEGYSAEALKAVLAVRLPEHMQPTQLIELQAMPVTANGKLDRRRLPVPQTRTQQGSAPRTALQASLLAIWQALFERDDIGIEDDFFELGGDSIVSIQAVGLARKAGLAITPKDLFSHPTIAALAEVTGSAQASESPAVVRASVQLDAVQLQALGLNGDQVEDAYPLSPMQQGMLFHSVQDGDDGLYVNQIEVGVLGADPQRMQAAWEAVAKHHAILRTAFLWEGEKEPLQVVLREAPSLLTLLDWRGRDDVATALRELADSERDKGFALGRAPLLRVLLVRTGENRYRLIWTYHHILMDGWSVSRLIGDVLRHYSGEALPPVAEYRHYIGWLKQQDPARSEAFWKARLADLEGPTHLARALPVKTPGEGYRALYTQLDAGQTARLAQFAQGQRVTLNTLVQAAWLLLLQRYSGQRTVTFGATVSGRPETLDGSAQMLGLFINTLPVVSRVPTEQSVGDWLREVQAWNLQIRDHQHTPLSDIQRWAGQGGQALFDSIIVFENQPVDRTLREWDGESLRFEDVSDFGLTSFAMDLMVSVDDGGLRIEYMHPCDQFDLATVEQLRGHMESLMQRLCDDASQAVGCLGLVEGPPLPLQQASEPVLNTPVHELIAQRAQAQPNHPALVLGDEVLDYAGLDRRATALAVQLRALGVGPETVVGVFMERSLELVVALLAVLKSGGAYVPLDPEYPAERLRYMMADAGMAVLLTQQRLQARVSVELAVTCLAVDNLELDVEADATALPQVEDLGLAYLIYTSGSTGKPKSVAVAHGPISMHVQAIARLYEMDSNERELHFMSFAFDGAHERWLTALVSGATLVIRDNSLWTAEQTLEVLSRQRITVACFPPAYLLELAEQAEILGAAPAVRVYCFGGDAVPDATFERVKRTLAPKYLVNGYGPTETVVTPLLWKTPLSGSCEAMYAPIGKAVGARTLYVLDGDLNPLPAGFVGELYIGGEGVARGYHDHRQQTAERFVADPFGAPGARLYRTGDLVRMRADGVVDYVGRVDHQVKVRGFRIELGEIEARLREQAGIKDALVVVRDSAQGRQLIGYVVAPAQDGLDRRLLAALRESLPDYMVPAQVVVMAQFPLTPNGKLDRKALPAPDFASREHVAPRTPLQVALVQIWQQVLGIEQVGISDNFFELGGDSLRTLKVISRVRAMPALGFELKLRDMMAKPTIAGLTAEQAPQAPQALLLLNQPVADSAPLFCMHAGFGTVFDYEALARRLEGRRTVYGVQCRMLLDRQWQDSSLEQMAVDYAAAIRAKQAQGPYHLIGWSLGGALALLVTRELEAQGQAVQWLGLVDSYVPLETGQDAEDWREDLQAFLCATLSMDPAAVKGGLAGHGAIQPQQVCGLIAGVIQRQPDQAAGYALLGADELAQTFIVSQRLKQLSRAVPPLPVVRAWLRCWWASGNPTAERAALEAQQPRIVRTQVVQASHYDILHSADCLEGLLATLEGEALSQD